MERYLRPRPHVQLFMRCTNFGRPLLSQVRLMDHSLKDNEASNQSDNLLSRVSDGWKVSTTIFLGSRVENSKFKILCKRITEELGINNLFKKTIEARWATSNTRFQVKTSRQ